MHQLTTLSIQIDLMVFWFKQACFSRKQKTRTCFCGVFSVISFNFIYCCKFVKLVKMYTCLYRKKRKKKTPPILPTPVFQILSNPPSLSKTHTYKHTEGPIDWHTHINIYLHHLLCTNSSYLYYIEWTIYWYQKFTIFYLYYMVKVIHLLIRCYKTRFFIWNTNNTDRNGVNKQNKHTHTTNTQRKITLERVS